MEFKNKNGVALKTTISDEIMNRISDIVESILKDQGIIYKRQKTTFSVMERNIGDLYLAQSEANIILIKEGVITLDMIMDDIKSNF